MTDRLGWGVIGAGERAVKTMFPALLASPSSRLLGVCGKDPEKAREAVSALPEVKVFDEMKDLLSDPEIEVVYISSPHFLHVPQAVMAIEAGKHVFMESPMSLSVDGANKLIEKAKSNDVKLGVAFQYRYHCALEKLKERLGNRGGSEILHIEAHAADPFDWPQGWWTDSNRAGPAALLRFGAHALDLISWLKSEPVLEVVAMVVEDQKKMVQTMVSIILRFPDDTMGFALGASSFKARDHCVRVEAGATRFQVQGDFTGQAPVVFRETVGGEEKTRVFEPEDSVGRMIDAFAGAVRTGADFQPQGIEGKETVKIICAVIESMKTKRAIRVRNVKRLTQ